jgi:hypothetical protein
MADTVMCKSPKTYIFIKLDGSQGKIVYRLFITNIKFNLSLLGKNRD